MQRNRQHTIRPLADPPYPTNARTHRNNDSSIGVIVLLLLYSVFGLVSAGRERQRHLDSVVAVVIALAVGGYAARVVVRPLGARACPRSIIRQGTRTLSAYDARTAA
jgi:hypothetical protein